MRLLYFVEHVDPRRWSQGTRQSQVTYVYIYMLNLQEHPEETPNLMVFIKRWFFQGSCKRRAKYAQYIAIIFNLGVYLFNVVFV